MKKFFSLILMASLGGCSSYKMNFECEAGKGVGCKSISQVNEMVNRNELGTSEHDLQEEILKTDLGYQPTDLLVPKKVRRIPERTARIWINSFTDPKGDYVDETYVYTVLSPGKWEEVR